MSLIYDAPRFGLKGSAAAAWLEAQGIAVPPQANSWLALGEDGRILRLGRGEYLIEGALAESLAARWQDGQPGLYRVPRYDAGFLLEGDAVPALLAEICTLDTRPHAIGGQVLLTLAAGISVTLLCETGPRYRLWCDATYGHYLQHTLREILE